MILSQMLNIARCATPQWVSILAIARANPNGASNRLLTRSTAVRLEYSRRGITAAIHRNKDPPKLRDAKGNFAGK